MAHVASEPAQFDQEVFERSGQGGRQGRLEGPTGLARQLNADGVAGPRGAPWGVSTINGNPARGTGLLNNELSVGRLVWNRLRYVKAPETGRRISRPNPPEQVLVKDVPELRILPQDLWDRVRARQRGAKCDTRPDTKARGYWDRRRPRFLLSGLMRCGRCGAGYTLANRERFGCASARNKGAVALDEPSTKDEALALIRSLIEAVVLVPEGAMLRIELKGELAGILHLASDSKKPSRLTPERLEQMKAVARGPIKPLPNSLCSISAARGPWRLAWRRGA